MISSILCLHMYRQDLIQCGSFDSAKIGREEDRRESLLIDEEKMQKRKSKEAEVAITLCGGVCCQHLHIIHPNVSFLFLSGKECSLTTRLEVFLYSLIWKVYVYHWNHQWKAFLLVFFFCSLFCLCDSLLFLLFVIAKAAQKIIHW